MPSWKNVLDEIGQEQQEVPVDRVRRKYLRKLHELTGRNTIAYYSGWLQLGGEVRGVDITDSDMNGFMNAIHTLDCSKGLDLILHTPGGRIDAAEALVTYLKLKFGNNIRAIVPQIALSAGTMIACASHEIVMGNQSSLGPMTCPQKLYHLLC